MAGRALATAKDLLRGGPLFTARAALGSATLPLGRGESIRVRRRSSDVEVVRQVRRDRQYALPYEVQVKRLERFEEDLRARGKVLEGFEEVRFAASTDWLDQTKLVYIEPQDHVFPERASGRTFQAEMGRRDFDLLVRGENLIYIRREN